MTRQHLKDIEHRNSEATLGACKASARFIRKLVASGIPLRYINTNDFSSCPTPRVYIGVGWMAPRFMKGYERWQDRDVRDAARWFKRMFPAKQSKS